MPITNTEDDLAGRLIEDMAYQSSITVRPAYYDVTLKGKVSRDNDSGDMLDIIYANKCFDIGYVGNWSNMLGVGDSAVQANRLPRMNAYTKMAKTIPGLIQKDFDLLASIGRE